ncbi:unnamed protein product [Closterium sp. NIES-54]
MATPRVLRFDVDDRPLEFSVWLLRTRRLLESQVQSGESLWAHATGDLPSPDDPTPLGSAPDDAARARFASQRADLTAWKSRDAAACITLSSLLPESEEAHFTRVRTASEFLTSIKARYSTPTTVSLGRLFLPFLFPYLALFERSADLIAHLRSLDFSYRAACTDAQLALLPPPIAITIYFIATSLPDHLASVRDVLLLKHPSELTIEVLEYALKDVKSNLRSVASASGAVPPPLFHRCTVPQLPTFTASLAIATTDVTAAAVTTSSRSRGRGGKRGGQGTGGGGGGGVAGGGGGGGASTGGGGSAGPGEASRAAAGDPATAAGGGDARARQPPSGLPAAAGGAAAWYLAHRQQQQPLPLQQPPQQQVSGPAQRQPQRGTPHAMYAVVDSSASVSVYSSVASLGACLAELPLASVGTCVDTSPGARSEDASLSFTLDSGASHCFFRDHTTLTPLPAPVSVALADPTSGPVTARYTTTLPCPAVPSGSLTGFHVPSFSRNLVGVRPRVSQHMGVWIEPSSETAVCVDGDTYAPLATFTTEPGSGLYTLHTDPGVQQQQRQQQLLRQQRQQQQQRLLPSAPVTSPSLVPASHQVAASPQVAMFGQVPVSGPVATSCSCRSLAHPTVLWHHRTRYPSLPCLRAMSRQRLVLGLPRVLPSLPPSLAPPCGPCVEGRLRATPHSSSLRPATEPFETLHLDAWDPAPRLGPERERFFFVVVDDYSRYTTVFPLAKKSEVTSTLIRWLLTIEGTRGRRVSCLHSDRGGLVMEIARTSLTHARAPHFLWPYAVRYAAHHLNLWPRVSRPEASPTSLWTGSPGVASRFRVWGCLALVRDTSVDKLSPRAVPCVFLGFPEDSSDFTFYHPPSHRFFYSRDVRFEESTPYYVRYLTQGLPVPPPPLFLTSAPPPAPPVQPPPPGPAPSGVSQATPPPLVAPQVQPPSPQSSSQPAADPVGAGARGEGPTGASSGGAGVGAEPVVARDSCLPGAGAGPADFGGAASGGAGAPSSGPGEPGRVSVGGADSGGGAPGALECGPGAAAAPDTTPPPHPYPTQHQARVHRAHEEQLELEREERELQRLEEQLQQPRLEPPQQQEAQELEPLQQQPPQQQQQPPPPQQQQPLPPPPVSSLRALGLPSRSPSSSPSPPVSGPPLPHPDPSPAVFPYSESSLSPPPSQTWASRRSPRARPSSPVPFTDLRTALLRSSRPRPSPSVLPSPPESALTASLSTPVTDYYRTYRPILSRVLASLVTHPRASVSSFSALTAAVTEFASTRRLDFATSLVAAPPSSPLAVGGVSALGCDAVEDRQFELEFLAVASPHLCAMVLAPEGDPDALDISTPRTYAEAVSGPWASQWRAAMDAEMASYRSTGTYVDEARYVARGFSQREGVDFFQTFAPTPKMTTLRVLLHVAAQRDYELQSLDFSTAFLQGSLNEEVWLRRPSAFTGTFPPGTQWRLRRPVYGLRPAPREWHDTLRSTLADLGFQPSSADPPLFVRRGSTSFFVLVYVDDMVFANAVRVALADVKSELQKRHTCTDLGELRHYLGLQITRDRAARTITLSQSHMVQQVLQRFELQHSTVQRTPLAVDHRLTGPFPDEPFESSGPYAELVGCLMYLMTCTRPDLAFPLSVLARFVAPGRHRPVHWTAAVRVAKYLATTSGMGLVLGRQQPVVLTGHCESSYADDAETHRSTQGYCFSLGSGAVSWRSTRSSSVSTSTAEAEIYAGAMAAQELRWLTFLLADLGERPSSAPTLFTDNKVSILLCREPRLESRVKHIHVRYFLLRELQRRGQARFEFMESEANTADIFTKALPPCDHRSPRPTLQTSSPRRFHLVTVRM